jgi:hypothetical protein
MVRCFFMLFVAIIMCMSCAHPEKRSARYDPHACPICAQISKGACSFCNGSGHCLYCEGKKDRRIVSPNIMDNPNIKPFSYKEQCSYCKGSGVCTYCNGKGKCWACGGTAKVSDDWQCLNTKMPAPR